MANGTRSEYLASLAKAFPERDSWGCVIGYYVYGGPQFSQRLAGPFPTRRAAEADEACAPLLRAEWARIVCGHVFTASGKLVQETP